MAGFNFDSWRDDVLNGKAPVLWPVGDGPLSRFAVGPGRVILLGGAPGAGKTTLAMQLVFDALRHTPSLRACVANVEMDPAALMNKALARFAQVGVGTIQSRAFTPDQRDKIERAMDGMRPVVDRISFAEKPHSLRNVIETARDNRAEILVLDYLQRIDPALSDKDRYRDKRSQVDALMTVARDIAANAGMSVLMLSAVGRVKDGRGKSGYAGNRMGLGSFKESGECEYGADDAFVLTRDGDMPELATLLHLKSRYGSTGDVMLKFEGEYQRFMPLTDSPPPTPNRKRP